MKTIRILFVFTVIALYGCSGISNDSMVGPAEKYAAEDARALGDGNKDLLDIQRQLLRARAIETRLRQNGHPEAADRYVAVFEETLKNEYPEVAEEIF